LVTGASEGAGRELAREVERVGGRVLLLPLEASDAEAVGRAAGRIARWAARGARASERNTRPSASTHRGGLLALAGAGLLLGAAATKLLLAVRAQRLSDTQVERFREGGLI
jgi:hypothetical protein